MVGFNSLSCVFYTCR